MTSHSSMGDKGVGQPQGEVITRRVGIGPPKGLFGGGIRNQRTTPSSLEVVLVV